MVEHLKMKIKIVINISIVIFLIYLIVILICNQKIIGQICCVAQQIWSILQIVNVIRKKK